MGLKVKLLSYTAGGEQLIATAGRVCYSASDIDKLQESITPEKVVEMINKLGKSGHTSTVSAISFAILRSFKKCCPRNFFGFTNPIPLFFYR